MASVTVSASSSTDGGGSGLAGYQYRTSTNAGVSWSNPAAGNSVAITAEGADAGAVPGAGQRRQRHRLDAGQRRPRAAQSRSTARRPPTRPASAAAPPRGRRAANEAITVSGSTDSPGSGVSGYQFRTSTDSGVTWGNPTTAATATITNQGTTLVQFRAVDYSGLASNWVPSSPTPGSTVMLDRTLPTAPTVTGGSTSWQSVASVTVSASASTDSGGRASPATSTAPRPPTASAGARPPRVIRDISAEGQTLVQFRSTDNAGNASAWTPSAAGAGNTVKIDRTAPTDPTG